MNWRIILATLCIIISGCGSTETDFTGSWYNSEHDLEMYIHNTWPGPIDFIVAGETLSYDCLSENMQDEFIYLVLQPSDMRFVNDHFKILEYSEIRPDLIRIVSYDGSAVECTMLEIGEPEYVYTETFSR